MSGSNDVNEDDDEDRNNMFMSVDSCSNSSSPKKTELDYETTIFQALVNEGKYIRVPISRRAQFSFNEKELRDAAHAEVARVTAQQEETEMNSRKRKGISAEDNLNNRDRNREHAKNTRLRKKCYVKKLQELVDRMNAQKELEERERKALGQRIYDTQTTRKNVIRLLLSNRASNVMDRDRWSSIIDEQHTLTLPITPYRSFNRGEIRGGHRVVKGIDALLADTASLALLVESVGQGTEQWRDAVKRGQGCRVCYLTAREDMLAAGDFVMCRYLMRVEGWEQVGAKCGVVQQGMMHCRFDRDSNKLVAVEMVFDVMGFLQQLQRASGLSSQDVVTTSTVDKALQLMDVDFSSKTDGSSSSAAAPSSSRSLLAVVSCSAPFAVLSASRSWTALCGENKSSSSGAELLHQLRAHEFQNELLLKLLSEASEGRPGSAIYMANRAARPNSTSSNSAPQVHYLKVLPLTSDPSDQSPPQQSSSSSSFPSPSPVSVTHLLVELVDLPLTELEAATLLSNRMDESLTPHVAQRSVAVSSEVCVSSLSSSRREESNVPDSQLAQSFSSDVGASRRSRGSDRSSTQQQHQEETDSQRQQQGVNSAPMGSVGSSTRSRRST